MKARRMTMADYADLGIVPPRTFVGYRPGGIFSAAQRRHKSGEKRPTILTL